LSAGVQKVKQLQSF